uniref:RNase H type-1 domain-containing protein n=1 Tax=Fagus sylvatica TaxID=28930 RepID=A0A2N9GD11_FAGSY
MAGETSGPGPSEQEIRMVALERKFDELLSFVQLIAKRNPDDENQRKEDDRDANNEEPEGHSNANTTPPPPTPPKPEGKDSQLDSKIDSLEEKIRLMQGLNSFGNTDFSSMSWFPNMTMPPKFKAPEFEKYNGRGDPMIHLQMYCRKMAPYADNEPLLIQTFQDTLTGHAAEWYSQLKKISHWKELADTFLAQYGFNSQIALDRFDLQRMEKKSNETFREYAQRWREKAARARPPLDEREMIKIFVDTLKNPYFDRMIGLQMQFFVDLIPVGERIEDALKTKKIVDMTALMALAEQAAKKAPTKKKEGDVQMIGRSNGRPRQVLPTFTMQPIQPRPTPTPAPTQVPAPAPAPQIPARPVGNQFNDNRLPRKEPKAIHTITHASDRVVPHSDREESNLTHYPKALQRPTEKGLQPELNLRLPLWRSLPNITTNPLPNHPEGGVNMVEIEEGGEERISWRRLFYTLEKQRHITPLEAPPGPSTGDACEYHSGARGHSLECCEEFKKEVANLMEKGLVKKEEIGGDCQSYDPSDLDWYAELNLDDIVKDEMDLDNLQDEGDDWGYFMEDDTDEWRNVDFTKLFQFPCLIVPPGFEMLEFEIFYENGDPEVPFAEVRREDGLTLGERAFDDLAFLDRYRHNLKTPPPNNITTTTAEEEYAGPMVEGLSIHTIAKEEDSTTPPTRHCQQGEEAKMWTCVPLLQRISSSNEITRKTSNDPHVSEIDNKTNCSLDNIDNSDEEIELPNDILEALERQDEGSKPNIEELEIINLADEGEEPTEVKIGTRCTTEQKEALIALLREFHEIFAWSYQDMPGLDTDIVVHKIPLKPECKPVKQALRRMKPEVILKIKEEVEKQLKAATNAVFSFMDGFSGYNQIKMAEEDKSKTAFVTHWGTFVYDVMPFGLKNAGATYQRAMVTLFHDMIHHEIEVYVDDMIAKSRTAQDHLTDLRKLFQRLKKYQLRLNPNKCAFGTTSGKLLGFIVNGRGIKIDPAKVQAIRSMPAPKTEKEIRSFLGRINYIARFIAQLTATCEPLFKLLRKDASPHSIPHSPRSIHGLHVGTTRRDWEERSKQSTILARSSPSRRPATCWLRRCAAHWLRASKKLRQYMLYYTTWLVSRMDPIKYIFEKPTLTGKIARWQVLLSEFDILFVAQKAIKGQAIADYLADYPSEQWKLYFDGAANSVGSGIGAVLVSPKGQQTPIAVKLGFDCTNNMTEYEACIVGLQVALEFGAYELEVFGDSLLIVSQTNGEWQARDPKLIPYQRYISRLVPKFKYITFTYTPRAHNHFADALATLASLIKLVEGDDVRPLRIETRDIPAYCVCVEECMNVEAEIDNKPWYYDIKRFIQDREYPPRATENEKKYIRRMAFQFFLSGEILYKQTHDATLLRCVDAEEANRLIQEMHAELMGAHANGPFLARKIMRAGYYWLTMERECIRHVQTCHKCQMYQNCKNAPLSISALWPHRGLSQLGEWTYASSSRSSIHNSAPYRPKMNGAVEAANKNVKKTETYKDWHEHLPYALCAYQTSVRTSVGATPYSLYEQLNFIDEKRLAALCHGQLYQRRIERAYNKKARPRTFQPGDLVLKKRNMALSDPRGKFAPSYEGPYVVKKAFSGGAIILADMDGEEFRSPINSDSVIKYHV